MSRELKFDESWTPLSQFPVRELNEQSPQCCWIALDFSAKEFCLTILIWDAQKRDVTECERKTGKWKDFWRVLSTLDLGRLKHWLIGWGVSYALDRADFIGALDRGEVVLPCKKHSDDKNKHTGSLIMSGNIFEVDSVCGRNKIKLIDFANFGVDRPAVQSSAADNIHCLAAVALSSYLAACSTCGITVNRTTAAQVGWVKARQTLSVARPCCNLDFASRELERAAYHGGRCEAFRLGVIPGTTYSLDVQACYATICRDERLPFVCVAEYLAGCDPERIDPDGDDHWIADVVIRTDKADYPLRWMGTPIFPVGQFRTALPWPELRRAVKSRSVVRVLRGAVRSCPGASGVRRVVSGLAAQGRQAKRRHRLRLAQGDV